MTAPVTPTPAPKPDLSARDFFQQDDAALAEVLGIPSAETERPEELTPVETVPVEATPAAEAPAVSAQGEAPAPAPEVDIPKVERKLMTDFKVLDLEGELEIPEIQIEFKAKGETRKLPLDHVVRLAQFGFANEEREQQVLAAKRFVSEAEQQQAELQKAITQYEGYYERIFNDPAFYEEARLVFQQQNSPEARAQRAEQTLARERQSQQLERENQQLAGFVQQTVTPVVTRLLQENPLVNQTELVGRYSELTAPFLVNGRVPASRLQEIERVVNNDLTLWVQQAQYERTLAQQAQDRKQAAATQQVAATKRQAARVFAQPGKVPEQSVKPTKFESARDWLNATLPTASE